MNDDAPICVLGAGMAGCGAVHQLHSSGVGSVLYDKNPYFGGHTASFQNAGFTFDDGPHISFTQIERLQELFAENIRGEYEINKAFVNNYWRGHWIKHPAHCNLFGLPVDLVTDIIRDFVAAQNNEHGRICNYADWLIASYGKTFAETFPMEYGFKYHTTTASNMNTSWLGPRMYRPSLDEVLRGALSPTTPDVHYVTEYRYPSRGGFVSYIEPFRKQTDLRLGHKLVALDPSARELRFANGHVTGYRQVISSIPLPELIPMVAGAPTDVLTAARRLACTTAVLVNVGIDREDISEAHWTYFYDRDYFFTRLSFPHLMSGSNVPPGAGSIQAEVYYSAKYRPLDRSPDECVEPVLRDLRRCGLIRDSDRVLHTRASLVPYANVIFDLETAAALATVHGFLDNVGVLYCGRYGRWAYNWTDQAFVSGEKAAQKALDAAVLLT